MAAPAVSHSAAQLVSSVSSPPMAGRRPRMRMWSKARLRAMRAAQPRKRSASPVKESRSRAICSQASEVTSSASPSPTSVRTYPSSRGCTARYTARNAFSSPSCAASTAAVSSASSPSKVPNPFTVLYVWRKSARYGFQAPLVHE